MTANELANMMTGRQYLNEITRQEVSNAEASGLVVVYGQSDDCVEFAGAINDEASAYGGCTILIDQKGLLEHWSSASESESAAAEFLARKPNAKSIKAVWCEKGQPFGWTFKTDIPHCTFAIFDGADMYCKGIIFEHKELQ